MQLKGKLARLRKHRKPRKVRAENFGMQQIQLFEVVVVLITKKNMDNLLSRGFFGLFPLH